MTTAESRAFIQRYAEALSGKAKPASVVNQYVADSDEALKQHIADAEAAFPRYKLIAEDLIAEGDKAVVRFMLHATHQGEFMGMPPTNRAVSIGSINFLHCVDGQIVEQWIDYDGLGMLQQLGAVPMPQPATV